MRNKLQYLAAAAVIMAVACTSCKGRYADATPNGETIEVNVVPTSVVSPDSVTTAVLSEDSDAPVTTEVVTVSSMKSLNNAKSLKEK